MIPGIIAVIASLFFLFVSMYGFKGTKMDNIVARKNLENHFGAMKDPEEATREDLKAQIFEALKQGDAKWGQEHPESAEKDYEPVAGGAKE